MALCITVVGRPNVGKSSLFNLYTQSQQAIVIDQPGVTRDRQIMATQYNNRPFTLIDTAGYLVKDHPLLASQLQQQLQSAIQSSDCLIFMVDGRHGLHPDDSLIADVCRRSEKPIWLVVNKIDGQHKDLALGEFYTLGFKTTMAISAKKRIGHNQLIESILDTMGANQNLTTAHLVDDPISITIIGKPNVGKSTLMNQLLNENRAIVADMPGTTRDSTHALFTMNNQCFKLVDTAGIRRKSKVTEHVEKIAALKALESIEHADVAVMMIDARAPLNDQDKRLINHIQDQGRCCIIALNFWDTLSTADQKAAFLNYRHALGPFSHLPLMPLSAKKGWGKKKLLSQIIRVDKMSRKKLGSAWLTRILLQALTNHPPPMLQGRRIKPKFAHQGGIKPLTIIIHGKQTQSLPQSYQRYLIQSFRQAIGLVGSPIHLVLRNDANPYQPSSS